nr:retrovirus-related Pol polyprotein from transposon TNT 1-94 [Tanacetum cinerariifolium]
MVKFLASKDEASDFIIKSLKMIQVRLNAPVRNIHTDNGIEFVNQTLHIYYESVVAAAPRAVDLADSPVSTSIDQDAPSTKLISQGSSCNVRPIHTPFESLGRWSKDDPIANDTRMSLKAYSDADHARCQDTRRSTSGSTQFLGDKLVSCSSKKQKSTAISST